MLRRLEVVPKLPGMLTCMYVALTLSEWAIAGLHFFLAALARYIHGAVHWMPMQLGSPTGSGDWDSSLSKSSSNTDKT
ncbi:hypothetical protein C8R45DRAFT_298014 [Mycena sanguinolenta]|nr:hypothetical protein C8R45DRAFT_298014 [Mycena sanguinolenta]